MTRRISADAPFLRVAIAALFVVIILVGLAPVALAGDEPQGNESYQSRGRFDERSADVLEPGDDDQPTVTPRRRGPYVSVVATRSDDASRVAPVSGQPPSEARGRWIDAIRLFVLRLGFALRSPS
jgi:hypothetical protein